jgi:competence protein ComEC
MVIVAFLLGAPALGFTAVKVSSDRIAAPVLDSRLGPTLVRGRILNVEPGLKGLRLTLAVLSIDRLAASEAPRRVRIRVRPSMVPAKVGGRGEALGSGAEIKVLAILMPPPAPAVPGGFDFARAAWFDGVGAVGFAVKAPEVAGSGVEGGASPGWFATLRNAIGDLRGALFQRITQAVPGAAGGIAAALMTGERGQIPADAMEAMRAAGLAHLLAISGLHVGLVTGILFFGLRALLALFPRVTLRYPIKKWAAGAALVGAFGYMLLTGATVPTQRAFLMVALVLGAVMLDRTALSMRLVAFAAVIVLLITPDSITGPSFQMSFAAVAALIAGFEVLRAPLSRFKGAGRLGRRTLIYVMGVLITTLIAGMATAPFALYHFNRFAVFGLVANLGAVPVTAFWIMPFATLAFLLMPLGLEEFALKPMAWGIETVMAIAGKISASPGASYYVPTMPIWGLGLVTLGGLWLILWRRPWRLAGLGVVAAGLLSFLAAPAPDLLIASDGRSFAVRNADGRLVFSGTRGSSFQKNIWLRRSGLPSEVTRGRRSKRDRARASLAAAKGGVLRCDSFACIANVGGRVVSLIRNPGATREDCARAHLVIALTSLYRFPCRGPGLVITRKDLFRGGTHAVWFQDSGGIRVETVAAHRGVRPWTGGKGR